MAVWAAGNGALPACIPWGALGSWLMPHASRAHVLCCAVGTTQPRNAHKLLALG